MEKEYKIEITEEKKYTISIQQINSDIDTLNRNFERFGGAWEYNDGDYGCISIAEDELMLCKGISDRYPFEYQYNPSDFDKNPNDLDEDWSDIKFDINDFNENNVNKTNYDKVDAVADDFRIDLIAMAVDQNMTTNELGFVDLGYAPMFASVWDAIHIAANAAK